MISDFENISDSLRNSYEFYIRQQEVLNKKLLKLKLDSIYETSFKNGKLLKELFQAKDTGIKPNLYYYWRKEKLVPNKGEKNWVNINFVEYIWLQILLSLKNMTVPIPIVNQIKEKLFYKRKQENLDSFMEVIRTYDKDKQLDKAIQSLSSLNLQDVMIKEFLNEEVNYLYEHINSCLENKPIYIVIDHHKNIQVAEKFQIDTTVIVIPISKYIQAFFEDDSKQKFWTATGILSDREAHLIGEYQHFEKNKESFTLYVNYNMTTGFEINDIKTLKEILVFKKYETIHNQNKDLVLERKA